MNTILLLQGHHSTLLKGNEPSAVEPLVRAARFDRVPFVRIDGPDAPGVWIDPRAVVAILGAESRQAHARAAASAPDPRPRPLPVGSAVAL